MKNPMEYGKVKSVDYVRLPLEGTLNTRDLGGYPTKDNKVTKFHIYIRSDRLTDITDKDNENLKNYGITDIIDLRGKTDIQSSFVSDDNINRKYFKFYYIPISNEKYEEYLKNNLDKKSFNHGVGYTYLLLNKIRINEIFDILANSQGGVLYHCTSGKDRTGLISALILGLCNVDIPDIIANYEVSNTNLLDKAMTDDYPENIRKSYPVYMETFIKNLLNEYGSFEKYILSCNVSKENIEKIRKKFCK